MKDERSRGRILLRRATDCIFIVGTTFTLNACAGTPLPYLQGSPGWPYPADETGKQFCSRVSLVADDRAQRKLITGVVLGIVATGAVIAGAAMGPDKTSDANWAAENRNALVSGAGGLLAIPSTLFLTRSADSSRASASAGEAMGLDDDVDAMKECLKARATLVNSRATLAERANSEFTDRLKALQKERDDAATEAATKEAAASAPGTPPAQAANLRADAASATAREGAAKQKILQLLQ